MSITSPKITDQGAPPSSRVPSSRVPSSRVPGSHKLSSAWLLTEAAGVRLAFSVGHISEVKPSEKCYPVPGLPAYVLGVMTWRGRVLPVMDLATVLELSDTAERIEKLLVAMPKGEQRVAVASVGDLVVGIVSDAIFGVMRVEDGLPQNTEDAPGILERLAPLELEQDGSIIYLLDVPRLLSMAQPGRQGP